MATRTLGVVGAGTMGAGIAQLALQCGYSVKLHDPFPEALTKGLDRVKKGLEKGVFRRKLTQEEADEALGRLSSAADLKSVCDCDILVEAIIEDLESKRKLFRDLDSLAAPEKILGTNTSSLSVGAVAENLTHPERVVGIHFFNPPVVMKLVEIVRHREVSDECFRGAWDLAAALGRTPVEVKDTAGFLVNRVVRSYYLVAQRLAAEGAGTFAQIDSAVKKIGEVPMGPFELMDFIGLEVNLKISRTVYEGLGRPERLKPHAIQEAVVASGAYGRKTGKGFYLYGENASGGRENPDALGHLPKQNAPLDAEILWGRIMSAICDEADIVVSEGVASEEGVDTAVRLAMNFPQGPFEWKKRAARA